MYFGLTRKKHDPHVTPLQFMAMSLLTWPLFLTATMVILLFCLIAGTGRVAKFSIMATINFLYRLPVRWTRVVAVTKEYHTDNKVVCDRHCKEFAKRVYL